MTKRVWMGITKLSAFTAYVDASHNMSVPIEAFEVSSKVIVELVHIARREGVPHTITRSAIGRGRPIVRLCWTLRGYNVTVRVRA